MIEDGIIIGGPHHGQKADPSQRVVYLPGKSPLREFLYGHDSHYDHMIPQQEPDRLYTYRLHTLTTPKRKYLVFLPEEVRGEDAMGFVLKKALGVRAR